jgi:F-type H+-transporting ATPase subunit delta
MKNPLLARRYAAGLAAALKDEAEYARVYRDVAGFASLLDRHAALGEALRRQFLSKAKKAAIAGEILDREGASPKSRRFILLLLHHRRLEILSQVVNDLPNVWRERRGVRSFEIRSVIPLTDGQRARLEAELGRLEGASVHCDYGLDPGLVGGLLVRKGNLVYDVSLKGQLERIQAVISER